MNMKKYILILCTLALALISCVTEDISGLETDGVTTFKAVYSEDATKTVLEKLTPMWTSDDVISIYDGVNNRFVNTSTTIAATASFSGKLEGKGRTHYLAAYPYRDTLSFSLMGKSVYALYMPQVQTAVENTYDPSAAIAVAYSKTTDLSFRNISSLVKFTIASDNVTSVQFVPNNKISGLRLYRKPQIGLRAGKRSCKTWPPDV